MEVSSLAHVESHAVLGGHKPKAFQMAQTAHFFTVLSDTLYSNKKLAVVREVLCNAWDEHIHTNQTDKPIVVTLTDTELSIQDFGRGIPEDKIVENYCTYGASTKTKDDKQTGGFGLGSKAPFAYTSHFTVISRHAGFRTIYAVSRGSSETDGIPDIRTIVRVPDELTGMTVTIPLVEGDKSEFRELIGQIARNGEMNVKLNGMTLEVPDYSYGHKRGFVLFAAKSAPYLHNVNVRYGSAIYPVDLSHQDLRAYAENKQLSRLFSKHLHVLIFAQPGTVGPAPSREALSYTETTLETIKAALNDILACLTEPDSTSLDALLRKNLRGVKRRFFTSTFENVSAYDDRPVELNRFIGHQWYYGAPDGFVTRSEADLIEVAMMASNLKAKPSQVAMIAIKMALKEKSPEFKNYTGRLRRALRQLKRQEKTHYRYGYSGQRADRIVSNIFGGRRNWLRENRKVIPDLLPLKTQIKDRLCCYDRWQSLQPILLNETFPMGMKKLLVIESKANFLRWRAAQIRELTAESKTKDKYFRESDIEDKFVTSMRGVVILKKLSGADPLLAALVKCFNPEVVQIARIQEAKPVIETKLYDANELDIKRDDIPRFRLKGHERKTSAFRTMLDCKKSVDDTALLPYEFRNAALRPILEFYPSTGVTLTAAERIKAAKNGIVPLRDVIAQDLAACAKRKPVAERIYVLKNMCLSRSNFETGGKRCGHMGAWFRHEELLRIAFPWLPKLKPEDAKLVRLFEIARQVNDTTVQATIAEILDVGKKLVQAKGRKLVIDISWLEQTFPGVHLLEENSEVTQDRVELMKWLKVRGDRARKQGDVK